LKRWKVYGDSEIMSLATVLYTRRDNPESPFLYDNEKLASRP